MRLAAACFVVALLVGGALAQEGEIDCKRMKVKELRQMLAARGVKCEGCAEKADFQQLCEKEKDTPLLPVEDEPAAPAEPEKEKDVEEMLKGFKGIPGMEGVKMFSGDDLKNMNYEQMGNMFGGGGGRSKPRKTRSQYRRELVEFYQRYSLEDKLDGVDTALDKWKGREDRMFDALYKKYDAEITKHWDAQREKDDGAAYDDEIAGDHAGEEEEAMNKAFGSAAKDEV